jgi:hypothetical protein
MDIEKCLFVFYTIKTDGSYWEYGPLPGGWWLVGSGSTSAVGAPPKEYRREEQFNGFAESIDEMCEFLRIKFDELMANGSIERYKICKKYEA